MANKNITETLDGELYKAPHKKFNELVFFVHFYLGNKKILKRHIQFVNSLGFDAFAFNLKGASLGPKELLRWDWKTFKNTDWSRFLPVSSREKLGIKNIYADQIEGLLNELPGKKIVYAFSNPAASAIAAISQRGSDDVCALICDSGPSSDLSDSIMRLMQHELNVRSYVLRRILAPIMAPLWDFDMHKSLSNDLAQLPKNFPILSIRGWKDLIISPLQMDAVFEPHTHLNWQKLNLPEAGHLNGLKDFSSEYIPMVQKFITLHATLRP